MTISDMKYFKRRVRNEHRVRDRSRALADKNSIWYDSKACTLTFINAVRKHINVVNNKKLNISSRIRSYGFIVVAEKIQENGMIELKDAFDLFRKTVKDEILASGEENKKSVKSIVLEKYKSTDVRDMFFRNLPVLLVYGKTGTFLIKRSETIDWEKLINKIDWPGKDRIVKEKVAAEMKKFLKPALKYASSSLDRHLLKTVILNLTSKTFMRSGQVGVKFDNKSSEVARLETNRGLKKMKASKKTRYLEKKSQRKECSLRLEGSGRPSFASMYPELSSYLLAIFDEESSGLHSHPRLICDTLFLDKPRWVDMPRCVSILNQILGIPIKLSTAYTYTENYRANSHQAARHHQGKGINPGLSLRKSTRDGKKHPSINSHFATVNVKYTLQQLFEGHCSGIARDNKALVHTDVEVVQRPSKSWVKVSYSDHDWEKDSDRTLAITTYQLIKQKQLVKRPDFTSHLAGIPISKSKTSGLGISIVKMSYFEKEGAFRHMNETLFVMDNHQDHFIKNDRFVTQLIFTVDGGGDERPRNRLTKFCMVLLRRILDMDKIKVVSFAEGDSKLHSVERFHVAENRALSQCGVIDSHKVHQSEMNEKGQFDVSKFRLNMEMAAKDAVSRISDTPYSDHRFKSYVAPPMADWVFDNQLEPLIKEFLRVDSTSHRISKNFLLSPQGPIWKSLCEKYQLDANKNLSAISIYNEANNPENNWNEQYGFTCYRPDQCWRGDKIEKFEIQPVIDATKLPEHHYISYDQAKELVSYFIQHEKVMPKWMTEPDFFLPSKNIDFVINKKEDILKDQTKLKDLSDMVGVSCQDILNYVHQKEEKEIQKAGRTEVLGQYKSTLGLLTKAELKLALEKYKTKFTKEQDNKADLVVLLADVLKKHDIDLKTFIKTFCY